MPYHHWVCTTVLIWPHKLRARSLTMASSREAPLKAAMACVVTTGNTMAASEQIIQEERKDMCAVVNKADGQLPWSTVGAHLAVGHKVGECLAQALLQAKLDRLQGAEWRRQAARHTDLKQ